MTESASWRCPTQHNCQLADQLRLSIVRLSSLSKVRVVNILIKVNQFVNLQRPLCNFEKDGTGFLAFQNLLLSPRPVWYIFRNLTITYKCLAPLVICSSCCMQ